MRMHRNNAQTTQKGKQERTKVDSGPQRGEMDGNMFQIEQARTFLRSKIIKQLFYNILPCSQYT